MNKLEDFYANREMMAKYFSEEVLKQKEEELLQGELETAVSQSMAQLLAGIKTPISITIDYDPQEGVTVTIAHESSALGEEPMTRSYSPRSESFGFTVRFSRWNRGATQKCQRDDDCHTESDRHAQGGGLPWAVVQGLPIGKSQPKNRCGFQVPRVC